jgi:hypothetical protein
MVSAPPPDAASLWRALSRIPPRSAQLLVFRCVERRSPGECAALYGTSREALDVHVLRAAALLEEALKDPGAGPVLPSDAPEMPFEWEVQQARSLEQSRFAGILSALEEHGPDIRRLYREAEQAELASPAARRADLLRRVGLVALIALALWLYLRNGR